MFISSIPYYRNTNTIKILAIVIYFKIYERIIKVHGGHACTVQRTCMYGPGDMHVRSRGHVCMVQGTCMYGPGDMYVRSRGHVCMVQGTCMYGPGDMYVWSRGHVCTVQGTCMYGPGDTFLDTGFCIRFYLLSV